MQWSPGQASGTPEGSELLFLLTIVLGLAPLQQCPGLLLCSSQYFIVLLHHRVDPPLPLPSSVMREPFGSCVQIVLDPSNPEVHAAARWGMTKATVTVSCSHYVTRQHDVS